MTDSAILSLDWALRGGTVALLLLTAGALGRDYGRLVPARLGALFAVVMPSQRLVVARFGAALDWRNDMDGVARLVADVIALTPRSQAATIQPR